MSALLAFNNPQCQAALGQLRKVLQGEWDANATLLDD